MGTTAQQPLAKETKYYRIEVDAWGALPMVRLVSRWGYVWTTAPRVSPWTEPERKLYHYIVNYLLANAFKNTRLQLTSADGSFSTTLGLDFSVGRAKWEYRHWTVSFHKLPGGSNPLSYPSEVNPATRQIKIDTGDMGDYTSCNAAMRCGVVNAIPHEFLHAIGYHHDEYRPNSPFLYDAKSIMNVGKQIRERHLTMVIADLEDLVPNAKFSLA